LCIQTKLLTFKNKEAFCISSNKLMHLNLSICTLG